MTSAVLTAEARKLPAFLRRDLLVMLSYRVAFISDVIHIAVQALLFSFVARLVDPAQLPLYGGSHASYLEFVMIGVVLSTVSGLLLQRVAMAIRQEQLIGTLEALLVSPTSTATVQAGSVVFDVLFIPIRMGALLLAVALVFGLNFKPAGIAPALLMVCAFVPFVWGLGLVSAAGIVTFRRGIGLVGAAMGALGLVSGAFFPLSLLPHWLQAVAELNPIAIAIESVREALIGGAGWSILGPDLFALLPLSALSLFLGGVAFRAALAREHRRGTLGTY